MSTHDDSPVTEDRVHQIVDGQATSFERDRLARATDLETMRARKNTRVQRQFWFLFVFMFTCFVMLAFRTELNSKTIEETVTANKVAVYTACTVRVEQAMSFNIGRETLIRLVIDAPTATPVGEEAKADTIKRLRDGLLLPLEDCGPPPAR